MTDSEYRAARRYDRGAGPTWRCTACSAWQSDDGEDVQACADCGTESHIGDVTAQVSSVSDGEAPKASVTWLGR
jgi:rRNA maturation endonuclease Nob1